VQTRNNLNDLTYDDMRRPGIIGRLVYIFEQVVPDPFVLSIGLTFIVVLLAAIFAPNRSFLLSLIPGMTACLPSWDLLPR
jgi:short-chain fatty acids transporter